jgi:hypothetical protein
VAVVRALLYALAVLGFAALQIVWGAAGLTTRRQDAHVVHRGDMAGDLQGMVMCMGGESSEKPLYRQRRLGQSEFGFCPEVLDWR